MYPRSHNGCLTMLNPPENITVANKDDAIQLQCLIPNAFRHEVIIQILYKIKRREITDDIICYVKEYGNHGPVAK